MNWIKCSDKLPEQDQCVLCTNDKHEYYTAYYSRIPSNFDPWYMDIWNSGHCCGREPHEPTHWMELPKYPEE